MFGASKGKSVLVTGAACSLLVKGGGCRRMCLAFGKQECVGYRNGSLMKRGPAHRILDLQDLLSKPLWDGCGSLVTFLVMIFMILSCVCWLRFLLRAAAIVLPAPWKMPSAGCNQARQ